MMRSTLVILAALTVVAAQGPGNGISKSTLAASHPKKVRPTPTPTPPARRRLRPTNALNRQPQDTYPWLMKYLPVMDAVDSCPSNKCLCGECGCELSRPIYLSFILFFFFLQI